jgi:outer membrane protein OmpA-like peptidoglycan-associated protein
MHTPGPMPEPEGLDYAEIADRLRRDADDRVADRKGRKKRKGLIVGAAAVAVAAGAVIFISQSSGKTTETASDSTVASAVSPETVPSSDPATVDTASLSIAPPAESFPLPTIAAPVSVGDTLPSAPELSSTAEAPTSTLAATTTVAQAVATVANAAPVDTAFDTTATELPVRYAVFQGGKIYLRGKVPTQAVADEIKGRAAAVIGDANVFVEYVIDPAAPIPNNAPIFVADTVLFGGGQATVQSEFQGLLDLGVTLLATYPKVRIIIEGHTDDRGEDDYNLALSQRRVDAIKDYLSSKGADLSRVEFVAKGETEPIADNTTSEGRQANRRIEFTIFDLLA